MRFFPLALVLGALGLACGHAPTPRLPQVEQASQAVHGGGERYRAHQRCVTTTHRMADFVQCMDQEGYHFITRSPAYPSPECWQLRESDADGEVLPPHCFEHAPDAPH